MRLALISDVHSNVHALEQVLAQLEREDVDLILNLGDLVGYNANPNECMELLQRRKVTQVFGIDRLERAAQNGRAVSSAIWRYALSVIRPQAQDERNAASHWR